MSGKALKSQISDTMLNGEQLAADTDNSNFADFKPGRPVAYKIEFKKSRDSLKMIGEIECQSESSGHFLDLKPRRPKINRIADEMKVEGNFSDETESRNMKDFKPVRPTINRINDSIDFGKKKY